MRNDDRRLIATDEPELQVGAELIDGKPAIVIDIAAVGPRAFAMTPAAARELGARLITAAAEADPTAHQAAIEDAARSFIAQLYLEAMVPTDTH